MSPQKIIVDRIQASCVLLPVQFFSFGVLAKCDFQSFSRYFVIFSCPEQFLNELLTHVPDYKLKKCMQFCQSFHQFFLQYPKCVKKVMIKSSKQKNGSEM